MLRLGDVEGGRARERDWIERDRRCMLDDQHMRERQRGPWRLNRESLGWRMRSSDLLELVVAGSDDGDAFVVGDELNS